MPLQVESFSHEMPVKNCTRVYLEPGRLPSYQSGLAQLLGCFHSLSTDYYRTEMAGSVGEATAPGRRRGKWLGFDLPSSLEFACVPGHAWMHTARKSSGSDGRFRPASWYSPVQPAPNATPPASCNKSVSLPKLHTRKVTFQELSHKFRKKLCGSDLDLDFLNAEIAGDLLETLNASEDWSSCFVLAADLGYFLSPMQSVKYMAVKTASAPVVRDSEDASSARPVRRRCIQSNLDLTTSTSRIRFDSCRIPTCARNPCCSGGAPKFRQTPSYRLHAEGDFVCDVCQRKLPTKGPKEVSTPMSEQFTLKARSVTPVFSVSAACV